MIDKSLSPYKFIHTQRNKPALSLLDECMNGCASGELECWCVCVSVCVSVCACMYVCVCSAGGVNQTALGVVSQLLHKQRP